MTVSRERGMVLVEDSDEDYAAFTRALRRTGHTVEVERYRSGVAFLEALRAEPVPRVRTVVVLDINMPILSGTDVLMEMRLDEGLRSLPVVVLTTSDDPREVRRCYELGAGGYFLKQGDFAEFSQRIGVLADYWLRAVHLT